VSFNLIERTAGNARAVLARIKKAVAISGFGKKQIAALSEPANAILLSHIGHDSLFGQDLFHHSASALFDWTVEPSSQEKCAGPFGPALSLPL